MYRVNVYQIKSADNQKKILSADCAYYTVLFMGSDCPVKCSDQVILAAYQQYRHSDSWGSYHLYLLVKHLLLLIIIRYTTQADTATATADV